MKKLILITSILAVFTLGCGLFGSLKDRLTGGASGGSNAPNGTSTGGTNPKEDVIQASKKFIALPSFSAKMEGMGQTEIKSQVDYVAPDRYHVTYLAGTGAGIEMISIGNQAYMKTGGKWSKTPGNSNTPNLRDSFTDEGLKTLSDVKFEGEDTVDGTSALVYTYKNVTPVGSFPFSAKIWVGTQTGIPIKIVAEYTNGVLKQMTVNYDTVSPVTIEPPIK